MALFDTPQGEANFKVNLWLSTLIDNYTESCAETHIEWDNISPELKEEINRLSYQLKRCMDISNREFKKHS